MYCYLWLKNTIVIFNNSRSCHKILLILHIASSLVALHVFAITSLSLTKLFTLHKNTFTFTPNNNYLLHGIWYLRQIQADNVQQGLFS